MEWDESYYSIKIYRVKKIGGLIVSKIQRLRDEKFYFWNSHINWKTREEIRFNTAIRRKQMSNLWLIKLHLQNNLYLDRRISRISKNKVFRHTIEGQEFQKSRTYRY